jgi:hypothetical protein
MHTSYQRDIDGLLGNYETLNTGQVERINSLVPGCDPTHLVAIEPDRS